MDGDGVSFLEKHKYWVIIAVLVILAVGGVVYLMRQNSLQEERFKEAQAEYRVRAEQYAQRRGDELATQLARKMVTEYLKKPGSRHDLGDPGILPDLGAVSDWETNTEQRAAPDGTAITTDIRQIGSTAPPPVDGAGSRRLDPANANSDFEGAVETSLPAVAKAQQHGPTNPAPAT